jgi:hypothetical protein
MHMSARAVYPNRPHALWHLVRAVKNNDVVRLQVTFYGVHASLVSRCMYSTRARPVLDPYSTLTRPVLDPYSTHTRPVLDPYTTRTRPRAPTFVCLINKGKHDELLFDALLFLALCWTFTRFDPTSLERCTRPGT